MKKGIVVLLLLGTLLISPLALAQERVQIYSGFDRFADSVRMLFSFGDKKVMLALEIREKELDSAIVNAESGNDTEAEENLERARKKLQFVQNKVTQNTAENIKTNIAETIDRIKEEKNLPDSFDTYVLEEEKTQLTAELVSIVTEEEGQDVTIDARENVVKVTVETSNAQTEIMEIETRINEIDIQIGEKTIEKAKNQVKEFSKTKSDRVISPPNNDFVDVVDEDENPTEHGTVDD